MSVPATPPPPHIAGAGFEATQKPENNPYSQPAFVGWLALVGAIVMMYVITWGMLIPGMLQARFSSTGDPAAIGTAWHSLGMWISIGFGIWFLNTLTSPWARVFVGAAIGFMIAIGYFPNPANNFVLGCTVGFALVGLACVKQRNKEIKWAADHKTT